MNRLCCPILILLLTLSTVASNNLFFGVTHSGKSALINTACGLNLPVAETNQMYSTTAQITSHDCLGSKVVDTVGVFDYQEEKPLKVHEVLKIILESISKTGLSSMLWVWSSKASVGNKELEEVFKTLRVLLPDVLPVAMIYNLFPASTSGVPEGYSKKFNIPLLTASILDASQVAKWIKDHTVVYRVELPANYEDYLLKHDIDGLRSKMLQLSLLSCDVVREQLTAITTKIKEIRIPEDQCKCNQDCRVTEKYCCGDVIGYCVTKCTRSYSDQACMEGVNRCYARCGDALGDATAKTSELLDQMNNQFKLISSENQDLMKACDKFNLGRREL